MIRSTAPLTAVLALSTLTAPARAQETEGVATIARRISPVEVQSTASRVLPLALGLQALQSDVDGRAHLRLLSGPAGGVQGIGVWGGPKGAILDFDEASFDGRFLSGAIGIDFDIDTNWVVGFRLGYDDTNLDTAIGGLSGGLDSRSLSLAFYAAWRPLDNWVIDGFVGVARSEFDFRNGGVSGEVNTDRFTTGLGAGAIYEIGPFAVSPRLQVAIGVDSAVDFPDSAGVEVTNDLATYVEASAGGAVSYPTSLGALSLSPWLSAEIVGTDDEAGSASLVGDTVHGRFAAGLRTRHGALAIDLEGRAAGFGTRDFNDYQGILRLSVTF
ncbi:MAG: autotransporter outer membrane beta-barrel domain-containing protein [Pseudomonadota bacterium]